MAKISSIDRKDSIEITPRRYESSDNTWVLTEVRWTGKSKSFRECGALFTREELLRFAVALEAISNGERMALTFTPTEPNFRYSLDARVGAKRRNEVSFVIRQMQPPFFKVAGRELCMKVDQSSLADFALVLRKEIANVMPAAKLPS